MTIGTEWHFIIYTLDDIFSTSGSKYQINLTKSTVKENPELLRNNVKRVIDIIVGLLKDRISVDSSSTSKRAKIKNLSKNNMYRGLGLEHLYLFFACINKKFFLEKVICVLNWNRHVIFYYLI